MNRMKLAAVAAALALPVVALAALIGEQELKFSGAEVMNVPVRGVDPRDPLRGHYIVGEFDWDWANPPDNDAAEALCVLTLDAARRPKVRLIARWTPGKKVDGCATVIAGRLRKLGTTTFVPQGLGTDSLRLYVSELRAPQLEELLRQRPGALSVDLAVRSDGTAAIKALRVDGQIIGR